MQSYPNVRVPRPDALDRALELLDAYIAQRMQDGLGPGVALALTDRQGLLAVRTYGLADVATRRAVTPDTLFQIGSISKAFVAAALLRQREAGRLDLSVPVTHYLDWFRVQSAYDEPITAHHLLTHTAGLACMIDTVPCSRYAVWQLRNTGSGFAPGAHWHYSNLGYRILGYVLEALAGVPYAEAMRAEVLEPLGLRASVSTITHETRERLALGYASTHYDDRPAYDDRPDRASASPFPTAWFEFDGGSGSLACTPGDLATFLRMLLNHGKAECGPFLSEESFKLMTQPVIATQFPGYDQGYGLNVGQPEPYGGHTIVWTGGEMIGYEAAMIGDMTVGVGVVLFVNSFYVPWQETHFALQVLQAVAQGKDLPSLPAPEPPATYVENASQYVGRYRSQDRTFELVAEEHQLLMHYADARIALERWSPHVFYVPHPDFKLSTLKFGLEDGKVVEAFCGPDWYRNEHYDGPVEFDYPAEWDSYVGHYRTYSPWMSNFRALVRKGKIVLQWFGSYEQPLAALDDGAFRVGWATYSPERLRFDCFVRGKALRAVLSGAEYYRVDTP